MNLTDIISDYQNGLGLEALAKKNGVGKKKIKTVLLDAGIEIRGKGGVKKIELVDSIPRLIIESGKGYKTVAVSKKTGDVFNDYQNKSGVLSIHLSNLGVNTPTYYDSKKYYTEYGEHWFVKYFEFKQIEADDIIKCEHCEWTTIDIENKSGAMAKHLMDVHGIQHIESLNDNESVKCEICGEHLRMINNTHLKKHSITLSEYKIKYPSSKTVSNKTTDKLRTLAKSNQNFFKNNFKSKAETNIFTWLSAIFSDTEQGNRSLLNGIELDIVIPSKKIAIEYNGLKYHTEWFGGKDRWYHLNKQLLCAEKGYKLIHIYEDEWELNSEIVKSKLLTILGVSNTVRIGARSCVIKEIDKETSKKFINDYHIQGYGKTSVRLGAYYQDQLVGVMTFTRRSVDSYELSRYCTDYHYSIYGLGSKMVKYFINNYNPNDIISFADRCWTMDPLNNMYTKIGFEYSGYTNPDYRYYNSSVNRMKRYHKFGFRKQLLLSKYPELSANMTETEMVKTIGFDRIWNCGLFIYRMNLHFSK